MPRDARAEGFSRRHRFTVQGSFGAILRNSRKLRSPHAVLHVAPGISGPSRLGVALTRRVLPSAVDRNRVKRSIRELFRRHPVKNSGLDLVVMLRPPFAMDEQRGLVEEIRGLFDQAAETRP